MGGEVSSCGPVSNYYTNNYEYVGDGYYDNNAGVCYGGTPENNPPAKPAASSSVASSAPKKKLTVKTNFGNKEMPKAEAFAMGFSGGLGAGAAMLPAACGYAAERALDDPRDAGVGGTDGGNDTGGDAGYDAGHDGGPDGGPDGSPDGGSDAGGVCNNPPTVPVLTAPTSNASGVSVKPGFTWNAATDPDIATYGDALDYRLQVCSDNACSSVVLDKPGLSSLNYTPTAGEALNNNTPYWWRVFATDKCPTSVPSAIRKFTTEAMCTPWSFAETNFTTGTATNLVVNSGSVKLAEDYTAWTTMYDGTALPDASVPAWTANGTTTSNSVLGGELTLYSLGSNLTDYYSIMPTFNNATGGIVESRLKINGMDDSTPPNSMGMAFRIADGTRAIDFTLFNNSICEPANTGNCYTIPGGAASYHKYRMTFKNNDYMVYVDDAVALDGTGMSMGGAGGQNYIKVGDNATNADTSTTFDYIYYYNAGSKLPYKASGTYVPTSPVDSGVAGNDFGGGTISWLPASAPGLASVAVRAGDSADLSAVPWGAEMTANPATVPVGTLGRYMQWRLTLNGPTDTATVDDVDGSKTCP